MSIFRRIDIANEYNVSSGTVTRWVELATESKNSLQLTKLKDKFQVLDNPNNRAELTKLKEEGNKFKSHIHSVKVQPDAEFYKIFSEDQIIEIINSLKTKNAIPVKFDYFNGGANFWDAAYNQGLQSSSYTSIPITKALMQEFLDYLIYKTSDFDKINIIDIGPGNSELVKDFLEKLTTMNKLNKYVTLDISNEMLELSKQNITKWFDKKIYDKYICDIEKTDFANLLTLIKEEGTINVVLFLGSTIGNLEDRSHTLRNFRKSLDNEDLIVITNHIDNLSYRHKHANLKSYSKLATWIPGQLGINIDDENLITYYDENLGARAMAVRLDKDYQIDFTIRNRIISVDLVKGESILVYYHHPSTVEEIQNEMKQANLQLIQLTTQKNLSHLLVVAQAAKN